ncbi:MAG: CoA-binding protein [Treponema sp.]|jgi:redox-sensing transcriptional repressor|nr:CoA-binding protein [Treponema sp.]
MTLIPEPARVRLLHLMRIMEKFAQPLSSSRIEELTGWPSHTVRKDVSYLNGDGEGETGGAHGHFGGNSGYEPRLLVPAIRSALGLDTERKFCVVGLGRLGSAFLNEEISGSLEPEFSLGGEFELAAGFDKNVNRVEILKSTVPLYPAYKIGEVVGRFGIEIAILCVPAAEVQASAEKLAAAGIRGILNFAPVPLRLPPEIVVRNVFVLDELRELAIHMPPCGRRA